MARAAERARLVRWNSSHAPFGHAPGGSFHMRLVAIFMFAALAAPLPVAVACADSPLKLNEIMAGPARDWDGSGAFSSRDDEWVELVNTSAGTLDLAGYFITDGDSIPRYALSGT